MVSIMVLEMDAQDTFEEDLYFSEDGTFYTLREKVASKTANLGQYLKIPKFVNRADYSRGWKRSDSADPWTPDYWLQNVSDPPISDPASRNWKRFRRDIRTPHMIFIEMIGCLQRLKVKIKFKLNSK